MRFGKTAFRILLISFFFCFGAPSKAEVSQSSQPNIVYIVADDLGWKDVGFHGAEDIKTPNIDTLAAEGARLNQFYSQPMCTPTRAAIMTGRYPFRYGLQTVVIPSKGTYGLSTEEWLLPNALKEAGYKTSMVGKWHLGHADQKYWPRQRGFDYHYGAVIGEIDYFTHDSHGVLDWQRNNQPVEEEGYVTQLLGADAVRVVQEHDSKDPLFLYLAFTAPHSPYQAPQEYLERFAHIQEPTRRAYAAMISCLDDEIGKVIAALEEKGMREDTVIVFHSDNGGTKSKQFAGEADVSKITIPCDNGSFKGGKGQLYEGGTRVPAVVNWPGRIEPGTEVDGVVHVVDMLPTLVHLAGGTTDKCKPLDGKNVWDALSGGQDSPRSEVVYNIGPFNAGIRLGDWKLVWKTALPSNLELFNLAEDPGETTNLAEAHPEKVQELQSRIEELSAQAAPSLFLEAAYQAMFTGLFGPAPIPFGDNTDTVEP
jgi:arylsulfatase A-like enzyme